MTRFAMAAVLVLAGSANAWAQTQAPPPAPAPGSPAIVKSAADLANALAKAKVNPGGMSSSNVTTTDQYRVSLVKREKPAGALAHPGNTELLYIVEGSGAVVTGGTLVPAADGKPASIADGVTQKVVARRGLTDKRPLDFHLEELPDLARETLAVRSTASGRVTADDDRFVERRHRRRIGPARRANGFPRRAHKSGAGHALYEFASRRTSG